MGLPLNSLQLFKQIARDGFFQNMAKQQLGLNLFVFIIHDPMADNKFNELVTRHFYNWHLMSPGEYVVYSLC